MSDEKSLVSKAFFAFNKEAPQHAEAWSKLIQDLSMANVLDEKTKALAYLAVLAVLCIESGIPFHVQYARKAGASREVMIWNKS